MKYAITVTTLAAHIFVLRIADDDRSKASRLTFPLNPVGFWFRIMLKIAHDRALRWFLQNTKVVELDATGTAHPIHVEDSGEHIRLCRAGYNMVLASFANSSASDRKGVLSTEMILPPQHYLVKLLNAA